jgi:hypothetical protein
MGSDGLTTPLREMERRSGEAVLSNDNADGFAAVGRPRPDEFLDPRDGKWSNDRETRRGRGIDPQ